MTINYDELLAYAENLQEIYGQQIIDALVYSGNLHREVRKLTLDWWADFLLGMILGSMI